MGGIVAAFDPDQAELRRPGPTLLFVMTGDPIPPRKASGTEDDDARTEDAKRVVAEYTSALREILRRLRKLFN